MRPLADRRGMIVLVPQLLGRHVERAIAYTCDLSRNSPNANHLRRAHISTRLFATCIVRFTMGNCFGKPSSKNFDGEGRTVGSAPPQKKGVAGQTSAPQGGRTLGSSSQTPTGSSPREAAAKAAEVRTYQYGLDSDKSKRPSHAPKKMVATAWM